MLSEISWNQFKEWAAFSKLDPFFEWRADARAAQIVTLVANIFRASGTEAKPLSEFMLDFGDKPKPKRRQTWQEQKMIAMMIAMGSRE